MMTPDEVRAVTGIPFSDEQMAAITAPLAPGVIIAGAGTGKTTVMSARVVWLVGSGLVEPQEVLGLTFTRKAAAELADRIDGSLQQAGMRSAGDDAGRESVSTYDAFAARIVAEHGLRGGLDVEPTMIVGAVPYQLLERVVRRAPGPYPLLSQYQPGTIAQRAHALDAELQSHLVPIADAASFTKHAAGRFLEAPGYGKKIVKPYAQMLQAAERCEERLELLDVVDQYRRAKHELGLVEYADQLHTAVHLVRTVPGIGEELRRQYRVVLLDEYQDTSSAQAVLLSTLFHEHAVTAVGDPYQAIYGWRGAAASNILEFTDAFGEAVTRTLTVNRRSQTRILAVGNELAGTIPGEGVSLQAPDGTGWGRVEAARFDTEADEVAYIADQIVALEGTCAWSDIAILCRRNATLATVYDALRARDIPAEMVGIGGLLALPEVAPVVATLRLLADPLANPSLASLLTGPRWQVSPSDMTLLAGQAKCKLADETEALCLLEAVDDPPPGLSEHGRTSVESFRDEFRRMRQHASEPVADLVRRVIRWLGVEEELRARGQDTSQLEALAVACAEHPSVDGDASLGGLIAFLDAESQWGIGLEQATVSDADSVKLMTVHRAKGLEWEHVFLPSLIDGVFPSRPKGGNWAASAQQLPSPLRGDAAAIPQLEEYTNASLEAMKAELKEDHGHSEDRLAYVAATRARTRLVGTCHRWSPGVKRERQPSRYFEVIREEAARSGHAVDETTDVPDNPLDSGATTAEWPAREPDVVREPQRAAAELVRAAVGEADEWVTQSSDLPPEAVRQFEVWDDAITHVLAHRHRKELRLPRGLSATALIALRDDPQSFAEQLVRRMPRRPSVQATLGTRFHEWIQHRFESAGAFDEFERHSADLTELIEAFERGRFANRTPIAVEVPFAMAVGEFQLRGRMDAVFAWEGEYDEVVVDWKTSNAPADELQLAVYRRAWAEARGLDAARVGAAFHHVRDDRLVFATASPDLIASALSIQE